MHTPTALFSAVLSVLLFSLATPALALDDDGKPHRHPQLKRRIVALENSLAAVRADLTQLRSALDYQGREDASGGPGAVPPWVGPGNMCGDPCATDSDSDGLGDCEDPCPCDSSTADSDGDGTTDCLDPCPTDSTDACIDPCRTDFDADGTTDCEDPCPWDPATSTDSDGDGIIDCQDACPDDANDGCYDWCRLDQDGDNVADCKDPCPWAVEPADGQVVPDCPMPMASRVFSR